MRPTRLLPVLACLLLAPTAHALSEECPQEFDKCSVELYSKQSFELGPFTVVVEVTVENGSAEVETVATANPGDAGEVSFSFVAGPNATEGATYAIEILLEGVAPLSWPEGATRTFSHAPDPGVARVERFPFLVADDAAPGRVDTNFTVTVEAESHRGVASLQVLPAAQGESTTTRESPGAGVLAALAAGGLVAAFLGRRRER